MTLNRAQLEWLLPHRLPILMLDRVVDVVPRKCGKGVKRFSEDDPSFAGHFPGMPILPGVLAIEAIAQTAAAVFLARDVDDHATQTLGLLGKVSEMTFFHRIVPGDEVEFEIEIDRTVGPFAFVTGAATVNGKKCVAGKLTLKIGE
jgi:3-hydroxyacyl-[acyl-carrier-protein] dehydratase